jgi:hypothetical protein
LQRFFKVTRRDYGFTKKKVACMNSFQAQCSPKRRGRLKQSDDGAAKSRARTTQTKKKNENLPSALPTRKRWRRIRRWRQRAVAPGTPGQLPPLSTKGRNIGD